MENHHSRVIDSSGEGEHVAAVMMQSETASNSEIFLNRNCNCIYILERKKGERASSKFVQNFGYWKCETTTRPVHQSPNNIAHKSSKLFSGLLI